MTGNTVRIVREKPERAGSSSDYVCVTTCSDPNDETVTLATIQRVIEKSNAKATAAGKFRIKTLIMAKPMSLDAALGLATCYAECKKIPVVYAEQR
jgi:hypothetical protein